MITYFQYNVFKKTSIIVSISLILNHGLLAQNTVSNDTSWNIIWAFAASVLALVIAIVLAINLLKKEEGNETMVKIASAIREGADAFLAKQYKWAAIFVIFVGILLFILYSQDKSLANYWFFAPISFFIGATVSGLTGYLGIKISTRANARTAWATRKSLDAGLSVAFSSGTIMGMMIAGLGLLFVAGEYVGLKAMGANSPQISTILFAFCMGASSIALFARVGGGIYTKAADVGADLVGKVEAGIPEDDPRNPATIANNVGNNVGDVAGMGADLFESYVGSIIATIALAAAAFTTEAEKISAALAPLALAGLGILASSLGNMFIKTKNGASQESLLWSLRKGVYIAAVAVIILAFLLIRNLLDLPMGVFGAVIAGLVAGNIIGYFTEYYTSDIYKPTLAVAQSSKTGPATVIISGLGLGMKSTLIPVITIVVATMVAYLSAGGGSSAQMGLYGIGMAAIGMLSTLGITLSTDAYGPVAYNAGGIAEMSHLDPEVRERINALNSLGNTTAATGKGFAIGSAALTALTLLAALYSIFEKNPLIKDYLANFSLIEPKTLSGLFIGAMMPLFFSALTIEAVAKTAISLVEEVRRQFREIRGIMEGTGEPDHQKCVAISTNDALKQMVGPTLLATLTPVIVGIILGPAALVALLAGCLVSGFSMAIMMANAGGTWANAKKYIERGNLGGKGSDAHKAAVTGDTVGNPFKDTTGPSINILIKLMSMVSLVFGTFLAEAHITWFANIFK